jgi:outer membrane protein assembly factor BamE (lipoprotein component of BamABCDE complex)
MKVIRMTTLVLLITVPLTACLQFRSKRGVEVNWQTAVTEQLESGKSTRADVMDLLGPPSQIIALEEETALYYLFERTAGEGYILVLYNRFTVDARYDRAVFFFDENDLLREYATHIHQSDDE